MKREFLTMVFVSLILSDITFSQNFRFDSAYTVAYSNNYNYLNPEFEKINSSDYFYTDYFTLAYEKHDTNKSGSNIVFRKVLYDYIEDEVMISNDSFKNMEPAAGHSIILWQSDKTGNTDIYYSLYNDSVWNLPSALQTTTQNETNPDVAEYTIPGFSPAYLILYERENDIHFKILYGNNIIYDTILTASVSEPCSFPKIKMYNNRILIGYLKNVSAVKKIILTQAEINSSYIINWSATKEIANSKSVEDFSFCNGRDRNMLLIYGYDTLGNYKNIGVYENDTTKLILNYESGVNTSGKASVFAQSVPFYSSLNVFCWLKRTNDSAMIIAASGLDIDSVRKVFYLGDSSVDSRLDLSSYFPNISLNRFKYRLIWEKDTGNTTSLMMSHYNDFTAGINLHNESADGFALYQNYPNPFNPVTVIRYSLSENRFVTLKVYDVLGNEIATLVNEKQNSGSYDYQFSTVNYQLSSGIYFYKLEAGDFSDVKRMILLK